ncbi:aminoglycoside adenylyltransferase domain-containing protein [Saccharibacillus deserti]|uniref:aminoglycoside adenylyltransferase domain-containing protein n=1 Tax=Saccharibacillus deserti TaxID=1634444 RepID=UPI001556CC94
MREARRTADRAASRIGEALGAQVTGIYLHGSLAIGGFNPARSDIDLLVVVRERPERDRLRELTRSILDVHNGFPEGRDLEFSVVEEAVLHHFVHPTPCVYHYSGVHRQRYASDPDYLCADYEDADLAAQITVAYERGVALYGQPLRDLYPPVPRADYLESVWSDVSNAEAEIVDNSVYLTLNLCRVLMFLEEGAVASKKEGGEWAVKSLPEWSDIVRPVLASYQGEAESPPTVPESRLKAFAHAMMQAIGQQRSGGQP